MLRISNVSVRIISWSNPPKPRFTSGEGGVRHQFISVPPYGGTYHQLSKVLCYSVSYGKPIHAVSSILIYMSLTPLLNWAPQLKVHITI